MIRKIVMICLLLLPGAATVFAQDAEGTCGENLTWRLSNGTLTVSGTGEMSEHPWTTMAYQPSIQTAIIEDGVTSIGDKAFIECANLTSVSIGNSVTSIGEQAFLWCERLPAITIPGSVTSIGEQAFATCSSLVSVTIPRSVTSIGEGIFVNCISLTAIHVHEDNAVYASENGVLFDKAKTALIQYPAGKPDATYTIPESVTDIGFGAFMVCKHLTAIHVPENNPAYASENGVLFDRRKTALIQYPTGNPDADYTIPSSVTHIEYGAFAFCGNLITVDIPLGVISIGESAFTFCEQLHAVLIPGSVTSIGFSAFDDCLALTSVTIPASVTNIGEYAFEKCSALISAVNLNPTPQVIDDYVFFGVNFGNATLFVPSESVDAYRAAPGWRCFTHIQPNTSAIHAPLAASAVRVYSDPSGDGFRIEGLAAPAQVTVIHTNGQIVWQQIVGGDGSVSMAHLPSGVYLVHVNGRTVKIIQ